MRRHDGGAWFRRCAATNGIDPSAIGGRAWPAAPEQRRSSPGGLRERGAAGRLRRPWIPRPGRLARFAVLCVGLAVALLAGAQPPAGSAWHEPWTARVDVQFPGLDFHARYDFWRCACGDVLIRAEETEPGGVNTGELLLMNGRTLLVRGFDEPPGNLEHLLDSPMLMVQLVFTLLNRAVPGGPAAVTGERPVAVTEQARPLTLDTGLATGRFGVPWRIDGVVRPTAADAATLRYELSFRFENEQDGVSLGQAELRFTGTFGFGGEAFPYAGDLPMNGWRRQAVVYDDAAPPAVPAEGTLADERARAAGR